MVAHVARDPGHRAPRQDRVANLAVLDPETYQTVHARDAPRSGERAGVVATDVEGAHRLATRLTEMFHRCADVALRKVNEARRRSIEKRVQAADRLDDLSSFDVRQQKTKDRILKQPGFDDDAFIRSLNVVAEKARP